MSVCLSGRRHLPDRQKDVDLPNKTTVVDYSGINKDTKRQSNSSNKISLTNDFVGIRNSCIPCMWKTLAIVTYEMSHTSNLIYGPVSFGNYSWPSNNIIMIASPACTLFVHYGIWLWILGIEESGVATVLAY